LIDATEINIKAGDPIRADQFMMLVKAVRELMDVRGGDGVNARRSGGRLQLSVTPEVDRYLAKATSNFAPMAGTARVTGTADLYWDDGTNITATGESLTDVVCVSTTTMTSGNSIDSGMWCWVAMDGFGTWFISPLDCS
jgi:hypothetical protein